MWTRGKRKVMEREEEEERKKIKDDTAGSDTLELNASQDLDEEEEKEEVEFAAPSPKDEQVEVISVTPSPKKTVEVRPRLPLRQRLNQRSRPPILWSKEDLAKTNPGRTLPPPAREVTSLPPPAARVGGSPLPRLPIRLRLNTRSRPVILPPGSNHQTPPRPPRPMAPNRTPPRGRTPILDDGDLDASFTPSVTFSPNVSSNSTLASEGEGAEPGFSSDSDDEERKGNTCSSLGTSGTFWEKVL